MGLFSIFKRKATEMTLEQATAYMADMEKRGQAYAAKCKKELEAFKRDQDGDLKTYLEIDLEDRLGFAARDIDALMKKDFPEYDVINVTKNGGGAFGPNPHHLAYLKLKKEHEEGYE